MNQHRRGYRVNCLEIVRKYLEDNGFDGLQNQGECGCELSDLAPCSENITWCTPGYKVAPPEEEKEDCEFDFYICDSKDDKPWEE